MKRALLLFCILGLALSFALYQPIRTFALRSAIILLALALFMLTVFVTWRRRNIGKIVLGAGAVAVLWMLTTLRLIPVSPSEFCSSLDGYLGAPYVWGGETSRGIDCSGLFRAALEDQYLSRLQTGAALRIWLTDCSAATLGRCYEEIFSLLGEFRSIAELPSTPPPGTVAVTADGIHVLVHLSGDRWIQASPTEMTVVKRPKDANDPWHHCPVRLYTIREERSAP